MKKKLWIAAAAFGVLYLGVIAYHQLKPLPENVSYLGEARMIAEEEISFLYDLTYLNEENEEVYEHEIFEEVFALIDEAEHFLIIDMFLVNDFSTEDGSFPELSREFTDRIEARLEENPEMKVVFITDPINTTYFSHRSAHIDPLEAAGAEVIYTDLTRLRDSNYFYTAFWRIGLQWFGQSGSGWLPNVFGEDAPDATVRSYLKLANTKANHRKTIVSENAGIITSANAHDASAHHSNIGIRVQGETLRDIVESEKAVAAFSDGDLSRFPTEEELDEWIVSSGEEDRPVQAQMITEGKTKQALRKVIAAAEEGDTIWCGLFYLSDRNIIESLLTAASRGVTVNIILDPNQDAFGQDKIGIPNLPVASELKRRGGENMNVRWYDTQDEQYHSKILYADRGEVGNVIAGAANFTKRNLDDFNLENNISVTAPADTEIMTEVDDYFHRIWNNEDAIFTAAYEEYAPSYPAFKYFLYTLQKVTRFSTY
ncbi:phospholipase D family protein [Alkalicoccus daliensis]|uniref:phospholipase D n=1 Tax=Alkalicoccus daliensis TaxID=745820 RepID=A0A1H0JXT8_9BACI|nr:phospholipase D family protein [Alkalicoccus daliensis]SDO48565.1 Phosphatidylserine/phosphatidylglycerophosphate/cardiolipin synthase [Alkalicoccus daliensis]